MAANKTFTELPSGGVPQGTDVSGLDRSGAVESLGWTFLDMLSYIGGNLPVGAVITFVTSVPTGGKSGDVAIRTDPLPGSIYQNVAGTWTVMFTFPESNAADGTLLYGNGVPSDLIGKEFDSYLNKLTGGFYLRGALTWTLQYTVPTVSLNVFRYFTNSDVTGISTNLATGVVTITMASFPAIASAGIIRGNFDVRVGSDWTPFDAMPEVTKDGSGTILTAQFVFNQSFDEIRGRIF